MVLVLTCWAAIAACSPLASKGTMPPAASNGVLEPSVVPAFVAIAGRDGSLAGYARREDVLGPGDAPFLVYAEDLQTVVGQVFPGKGFVPAGVDPDSIPEIPVVVAPSGLVRRDDVDLVLYVQNDSLAEIHDAVLVDGQITSSGDFWGQSVGIGCYSMPLGAQLVLLDRSASKQGPSVVREIYTRGEEAKPPALWITVSRDGSVQQGTGVPAWASASPSC